MAEHEVSLLSDGEIASPIANLKDTIPKEYQTAVAMAYHSEFLTGKEGDIFDGEANLLRGEAVAVLSTLVKSLLISVERADNSVTTPRTATPTITAPNYGEIREISLSDRQITLDGAVISSDSRNAYSSHNGT